MCRRGKLACYLLYVLAGECHHVSVVRLVLREIHGYGREERHVTVLQQHCAPVLYHYAHGFGKLGGYYGFLGNIDKLERHFELHFVSGTQALEQPKDGRQCNKEQENKELLVHHARKQLFYPYVCS